MEFLTPLQQFDETDNIDWVRSIAGIDKQLYAKYNLSIEEIEYIERTIKPMNDITEQDAKAAMVQKMIQGNQ